MSKVMDYDSGDELEGTPSEELVGESEAVVDTGAVGAYRDDDGVWQYVPQHDEDRQRRHLARQIRTVWVE
jgi:hypothetical protein